MSTASSADKELVSHYQASSLHVPGLSSVRPHFQESDCVLCKARVITLQEACVISICVCLGVMPFMSLAHTVSLLTLDWLQPPALLSFLISAFP